MCYLLRNGQFGQRTLQADFVHLGKCLRSASDYGFLCGTDDRKRSAFTTSYFSTFIRKRLRREPGFLLNLFSGISIARCQERQHHPLEP